MFGQGLFVSNKLTSPLDDVIFTKMRDRLGTVLLELLISQFKRAVPSPEKNRDNRHCFRVKFH